jgi:hypothetical protein
MTASDILQQQQAWVELLEKSLAEPTPAAYASLLATREQQLAEVQSRIDNLTTQKVAAIQRFDAAIADHQRTFAVLRQGMLNAGPSGASQPSESGDSPSGRTRRSRSRNA